MNTAPTPPVIRRVATLTEALAVLAAHPDSPVVLLSPPEAALRLGPGWWQALTTMARARSGREFDDLLECDAASGRALEALRLGLRGIVLSADAPGRPTIAARCAALGAVLVERAPEVTSATDPTPKPG